MDAPAYGKTKKGFQCMLAGFEPYMSACMTVWHCLNAFVIANRFSNWFGETWIPFLSIHLLTKRNCESVNIMAPRYTHLISVYLFTDQHVMNISLRIMRPHIQFPSSLVLITTCYFCHYVVLSNLSRPRRRLRIRTRNSSKLISHIFSVVSVPKSLTSFYDCYDVTK